MVLLALLGVRCMQTDEHTLVLPCGGPRICSDHNSSIILHSHDGGLTDRRTSFQHNFSMDSMCRKILLNHWEELYLQPSNKSLLFGH